MSKKASHLRLTSARPAAPPPPRASMPSSELARYVKIWVQEGVYRQLSPKTQIARLSNLGKLQWFLEQEGHADCGQAEIRAFMAYAATGHGEKGGRWGMAKGRPCLARAPRPGTLLTYFAYLRAFFSWALSEGLLDVSPMQSMRAPRVPRDQMQPFTHAQMDALLQAARTGPHPKRDEALVLFFWDTGLRAGEVAALRLSAVDLTAKDAVVLGKGNKVRRVSFGVGTARALWAYLREDRRDPASVVSPSDAEAVQRRFLFEPDRGRGRSGAAGLTVSGLRQVIERLGRAAQIERERCSPHTLRNTFAVEFLRSGGDVFTLKEILGHTSLAMTNRYVALAQADIAASHRRHSPVDRYKKGQ